MLLGTRFEAFMKESPVSVMVHGVLERTLNPGALDELFEERAQVQYTKDLLFSQCVCIMSDVVLDVSPSVGAWYQDHPGELTVTRQAVYEKLKHVEPNVSAEVVRHSARELTPVLHRMKATREPWLPGYRVLVLDGNHLAGTEHRIFELRRTRAAALPGQCLALYDPQLDLIVDVLPCEDAYAQERSLLDEVLEKIEKRNVIVADRNFCTTGFLFGIHRRGGFFLIRQHKSTLSWRLTGRRKRVGTDGKGRPIYEQAVCLTDPATDETVTARRITIQLDEPLSNGDTEIHILTNLPAEDADALQIAAFYRGRWMIEDAFQHLTQDLKCEINTLGYPKAALFGFCLAVVAYNMVSMVKAAMRRVWGNRFVEEELSTYYLTLEISRVSTGMFIAIPPKHWKLFRGMTVDQFADTLLELAQHMNLVKYQKHKRGPKKKPPKKTSGKKIKHVSTARLLAMRQ
jgi:IS4 transposase